VNTDGSNCLKGEVREAFGNILQTRSAIGLETSPGYAEAKTVLDADWHIATKSDRRSRCIRQSTSRNGG